jgi:aspartate kinase
MALIVQKYGGTSVGSIERIQRVAERIIRCRKEDQIVVVLSAMSGETDRLTGWATALAASPDPREMDRLLATGEQVTVALLAMALIARGAPARSFTGRQTGILTDASHTKARIQEIATERIGRALADGLLPIVAGFQGVNAESDVTTLGRGGSDTTAVALAAALRADRCDIYTDVDGVYTADPNLVPSARKLARVAYEEMLEMASLGSKVLQTRSVEFAMRYQVPVRVVSSFNDNEGTWVTKEDTQMERESVLAVTSDKNQAKITLIGVPDRQGIASTIFGAIAQGNILVDMIIQNVGQQGLTDLSFTVPRNEADKAKGIMQDVAVEMGVRDIVVTTQIAKISIVGLGMRSHTGVAARMFSALSAEGINIMMISTSEIKISCVVDAKYTELAVRALHDAFQLEQAPSTSLPTS